MLTARRFIAVALGLGTFALVIPVAALAQGMQDNPECLGSNCGKQGEEGGGCGCGCGCSVWVAYTDDGDTLAYTDDADGDGKSDPVDNCPFQANRDQLDGDGDGVGDACDNCRQIQNRTQGNVDGDDDGDACDGDIDGDSLVNAADNCPFIPNKDQVDTNSDKIGNACSDDDDGDGIKDNDDNCPLVSNPDRTIPAGAVCSVDLDADFVSDSFDNCQGIKNPDQKDADADRLGDACDLDRDNDGILNTRDNCEFRPNPLQADDDRDGLGDACDALYCYVVDALRPESCLDPRAPFQVSGGPYRVVRRGESIRLPLFANRNGQAMEYAWTVLKRPQGSSAAIEHPVGSVSMSRDWQYVYLDGQVPKFTADVAGEYQFQVSGTLVFADRQYPDKSAATSLTRVTVDSPGAQSGGCSAAGAGLSLLALLALPGMLRRRRV